MKKLLLLLFLIPVLSWADSWGPKNKFESELSAKDLRVFNEMHTQVHKCYDEIYYYSKKFPERTGLSPTYACFCKTLGGPASHGGSVNCRGNDEFPNPRSFNLDQNHFWNKARHESKSDSAKIPTPKVSIEDAKIPTPKVSIEDAKIKCTDIGFKAGTEKFGDCVLELMR